MIRRDAPGTVIRAETFLRSIFINIVDALHIGFHGLKLRPQHHQCRKRGGKARGQCLERKHAAQSQVSVHNQPGPDTQNQHVAHRIQKGGQQIEIGDGNLKFQLFPV